MTPEEQIRSFNPNGPGIPGRLFGLPYTMETARLVILPVPWEATVTYHTGTAAAPEQIIRASQQLDIFQNGIADAWRLGVTSLPLAQEIRKESDRLRWLAKESAAYEDPEAKRLVAESIHKACENLNIYVKKQASQLLDQKKIVGLLGGDHSTPLGFLRALSERHSRFGILQIDAHADLRKAYEGKIYSHGSIMYNAMKMVAVSRLVQVGIRDWCEEEQELVKKSGGRVRTHHDEDLKLRMDRGESWESICRSIIKDLPEEVYVSFDIDGLDPSLCPHTGTPVPGGLSFFQASVLLRTLATSRRCIIGFDLNEVGSSDGTDWDANVGARILWQLCNWTGVSQGLLNYVPAK